MTEGRPTDEVVFLRNKSAGHRAKVPVPRGDRHWSLGYPAVGFTMYVGGVGVPLVMLFGQVDIWIIRGFPTRIRGRTSSFLA